MVPPVATNVTGVDITSLVAFRNDNDSTVGVLFLKDGSANPLTVEASFSQGRTQFKDSTQFTVPVK